MRNSLVAGNKSPTGPDILGPLTSQGYNLIQNTKDTTFAPTQAHETDLLQVAPSALGIDPLLRDNNGPTLTHALLLGSVAIDRIPPSNCRIKDISTDQRGVRRPQRVACDIGAYSVAEVDFSPPRKSLLQQLSTEAFCRERLSNRLTFVNE